MNEENEVEDFYQTVAEILKCEGHVYKQFPYSKRTRWNNRLAGNGRFPGHGLVRYFSSTHIHVQLICPPINGLFSSVDAALEAIKKSDD